MSKKEIKKRSQKSINEGVRKIFAKADARVKSGQDTFSADWQATLELFLFMMHEHLVANPGQLHPMQIDGQDEWDFYLDIQEVADLPPDTCALLMTPSAFKSIPVPKLEKRDTTVAWKRAVYSLIISDCSEHKKIMQVALPGIKSYGIDVFEEGKHFADYTYNTKEECIDDLSMQYGHFLTIRANGQESS
ncbi:hypothetical protein ACFL0M_00935 [Thermodesulfobacteriota bacterium]